MELDEKKFVCPFLSISFSHFNKIDFDISDKNNYMHHGTCFLVKNKKNSFFLTNHHVWNEFCNHYFIQEINYQNEKIRGVPCIYYNGKYIEIDYKKTVYNTNSFIYDGKSFKKDKNNVFTELSERNVITDEKKDIAILFPKDKLNCGFDVDFENLNSVNVKEGDTIHIWGYPIYYFQYHKSYNGPILIKGSISGLHKDDNNNDRIIVSATLYYGYSGSPIIHKKTKKLIGIATSSSSCIFPEVLTKNLDEIYDSKLINYKNIDVLRTFVYSIYQLQKSIQL